MFSMLQVHLINTADQKSESCKNRLFIQFHSEAQPRTAVGAEKLHNNQEQTLNGALLDSEL